MSDDRLGPEIEYWKAMCRNKHAEIERLREAVYQFQKFAIERGEQLISANNELLRLRALLETANIYGAGENAARIAAEEKLDLLANEMEYRGNSVAFIYQKKDAYAAALDRAFDELRKRNVPIDGKTPLATIIGNELDRLRAEVAVLRDELGIARERIRYFGKSTEAIDFALKEQKK